MYHDDDDLHMCINCHATIVGLENYISHRNAGPCKQQTPVKENEAPISVLPPLGMPKSEHIRSIPSATTPSSGDHLNFLNADFFFSSLELQSRRKDAVFEEVMGIEEVLEEEFEEREGQGMEHASGGKWGYEDYVQERDVWGGMEEKGREMGEMERGDMEGGHIVSKREGKKGGGKNVDLGEERELAGKRRLRASSEMEENSDFIEGLGSGGDFTIGESSAKCSLPPRESVLTTTRSHELDVHGTSEAGNCGVNEFTISLDICEMDIDNPGHKEDDGRYESSSAVPPRGHTRGKWVPGLASERMRKSGNAVEYFCRPCNKNIRNRRSYETHLSTLCHLKKLMSSSNNGISTVTAEGPRLRSRRLQVPKSKSTPCTTSSVNTCPTKEEANDFSITGDLNSQNYLMESLGIKRKVALSDSKENGCGSTEKGETVDEQPPKNISSSNDTCKRENFSTENVNTKEYLKHRTKRKAKRKKEISKIQKGCGHRVTSQKEGNKRKVSTSSNMDSLAPISTHSTYNVKMANKTSGDCNSLNEMGENVKESKSLFVEEKTSLLAEDKFLPISDPHISHGYCYDSLEIQEKQKKLKENIDLVRQRCDSSLLSSSENLQDQMMLGLELMRTEHLLSSNDKLVSKGENLSKGENAESREEVITKGSSCINPKLVSTGNAHVRKNCNDVADDNSPKIRKENFNEQLENLVSDEMCGSNTNKKIVYGSDKLSFTSVPSHNERNNFEGNEISTTGNDPNIVNDKLPQQSEGRSDSFFPPILISNQSVNIIKSMKEPNRMPKENDLSKCLVSVDTNSVSLLCDDKAALNSPKKVQNYLTLKVVKKGNHVMNMSKRFSYDQMHNLVDIICDGKNCKVGQSSGKKSKVQLGLHKNIYNRGKSSTLTQDVSHCSKQLSCSIKHLSSVAKGNSKVVIVKRGMSQVHQILAKNNILSQRGPILITNKTKGSFLDSSNLKRCQGENIKEETSWGNAKERPLHLQLPQALLCKIIKPEINQGAMKSVLAEKGAIVSGANISDFHGEHAVVNDIVVQKNCKYMDKRKQPSDHNESMMAKNLHFDIGSDDIHGCASESSFAAGDIPKDIAQFHCESFRTTSEEDKRKQASCDFDQVCTVDFDKSDGYLMASEGLPIEHEEVIESSQKCSSTFPTVNVVINVKSTPSEIGQIHSNLLTNEPGKSDISHNSLMKCDVNQHTSYSLEELLPKKLHEKSMECNPRESYYETKFVKSDSGKQILVHKTSNISDDLGEKFVSVNTLGTDIISILTSGTGLTQQNEVGNNVLYCCRLCKYKSSRHWCVERHLKKHFPRDRSFSCSKCSLSFLTLDNLKQHMKRHKKKRWCCSFQNCNQAFSTKQELLAHVSGPHVTEKSYKCHLCDYSGKNPLALIRHKKLHEEQVTVKCEACSQVCKKGSLSRHMKMHGKHDLYHCPFCYFTSYYLTSIHRHVTQSGLHPNKMLYNCPFCPVVEDDVEKHEETEHSYCRAHSSFSTNIAHEIVDHINSAHKVEKTYSYLYSNATEIMRKIHKLLRIICPSDL